MVGWSWYKLEGHGRKQALNQPRTPGFQPTHPSFLRVGSLAWRILFRCSKSPSCNNCIRLENTPAPQIASSMLLPVSCREGRRDHSNSKDRGRTWPGHVPFPPIANSIAPLFDNPVEHRCHYQTILPFLSGHFSVTSAGHLTRFILVFKLEDQASIVPP